MKILLINTDDAMGGAAIACLRLLKTLNQTEGIEATMLVQEKKRDNPNVKAITETWLQKKLAFARFVQERLFFKFQEKNKEIRFAFSPANSGIDISEHPLVQEADIIHLHWINFGFLSLKSLEKLFALNKPIVWTLHDMWAFTGGCHHSGDCENFQDTCGNCVQYLKNPYPTDLSNRIWQWKSAIFALRLRSGNNIELRSGNGTAIVGCSQWLSNRAKKSSLFKDFTVKAIPNPLDTNLFSPQNKVEARAKLGLPIDKKLILFVAAKVSVIWKGFSYFQESLEILKTQYSHNQDIELVVLGESDAETIQKLPFKAHALGRISDVNQIVSIYSAADVFVTSSIQENLPNTIMEAMACGTPAVGFEVGGIPEMIEYPNTGFLAKYKSAESLAEGMQWVLFEANYEELSKNARQKVLDNYSEKVVIEQYLGVYRNLVAQVS
ncbi:glycosyl transferase [Emticicia aquatilis]|uniref:Glycosyl transferase n=1 Tax=Emticicia aquatilis TaxID=1537369 RepID=A0A917DJ66_9BACT|nr:glycosyltransferase family 4 protein [Emticicia aquatilis]GGD42036.1 glycosyl transferase [Emticicia aquatilis]